ncbi:MAG: amino acid adenylation domain-containing protein [Ignavibacteria bacterium]|jgi:amino acid adenylation domain-containing protein/non-ribosomal peptide synthase protein (TIGR01720 family)|nr:amino acid adenylation domain-containing protein [Ignavibacteria bacterium]
MDNIKERITELSPEKLALLIKKLKKDKSPSDDAITHRRSIDDEYPMSSEQKGIWFLQQLNPESTFYNIPAAVRIKGRLNTQALLGALKTIIQRHEVLRANFILRDDEPRQKIRNFDHNTLEIPLLEYSGNLAPQALIDEAISEEKNRKFNLAEDSLFRIKLLSIQKDDHVLLLTFHHIISDGWSIGIFIKELSLLYRSYSLNKEPELEELPIQYSDYACWQQDYLKSSRHEKALLYWKEQLNSMPAEISLPLDKKRPQEQSFSGLHYTFFVSSELQSLISQECRAHNINPFVFFLTAYEILLHRYSNQQEFGIGVPVANRSKLRTQESIGLFTNTVVIKAELSKSPTVLDLLQRTKSTVLDAFEYQECPFERVVNALQPEHNSGISPLFQAVFDFQNRPLYSLGLPDLDVQMIDFERGTSKYDLTLSIEEGTDNYKCIFEYSTDLFLEDSIKGMSGNYLNILKYMTENVSKSACDFQMLPEHELNRILCEWNKTGNPYPREETFHHMFELQAAKTPKRTAVVFENNRLTFGELNRRANRLAHILISRGVGPESLVCLFMERSVDIMVAIFAILKAGGAYLPLDINSPIQRIRMILDDVKDPIILTQKSLKGRLENEEANLLCIDEIDEDPDEADYSNPAPKASPQNLAYVIYTSGSTGRPKGAMITHRSIVNLVHALEKNIYLKALDLRIENKIMSGVMNPGRRAKKPLKLMMNSSLIFDASIQQMILITKGHCIYILPDEIRRDGRAFVSYIRKHRIDVLDCVPSQLTMLLESGLLEENKYCPFLILPGGEAISSNVWKELAKARKTEIFNMYGPTETTVEVTAAHVNRSESQPLIGRPLNNVRLYVLDQYFNPQPIGVTGELFIAGECLGRGYLNRPEITAEKFIPDPFANTPGERIYRTGDLVRFTHTGDLEYMGRTDTQVKIRGFRIELGEIESAINELPGVKESLVIVREDAINDRRLTAYLIPKNKEVFSPESIKQMLRGKLPEYMIPSYLITLDEFPLMPSGKIDKKMLPAPKPEHSAFVHEFIAPSNPLECELVKICENVLSIKNIGMKDNFFELGGDSVKAAIFINRIRSGFRENIPVKAVFENPSLLELSSYLLKSYPGKFLNKGGSSPSSIKKAPRRGMTPLSYTQERMWFLEELEPGKAVYNLPVMFRIEGELDTYLLEKSLDKIISRHEVLRLSFSNIDGKARASVTPEIKIKCGITDISRLPEDKQNDLIGKISEEESVQAIPLNKAPLFRIRLLALSVKEYILIAVFHHIIMDEWSSRLLLRELSEIYNSLNSGRKPALPKLKIQYTDYAFWQREYLKGENLHRQLSYWKDKLSGIPLSLELPFDHPRPPIQTYRGDYISLDLSPELVKALRDFNRQSGVTLFMTMLSCFQVLLYRLSGQMDIVIGTPVANRSKEELEALIGFFVNTLVLRCRISRNMKFLDLLKVTTESSLEAFTYQELPFEMLVDALQPERTLSHSPLFQVMFAMQNMPLTDYELAPGIRIIPHEIKLNTSEFDLTLFIAEKSDESISMAFEYNTDLFEKETIEMFFRNFENILKSVTDSPETKIKDILLLSAEEEKETLECLIDGNTPKKSKYTELSSLLLKEESTKKVLSLWNRLDKKELDGTAQFFHRLFEEQALSSPDRIAVVSENESLTFGGLNRRANLLARYLIKKGASPDDIIGILLGRKTDLITSILAVMKSGAGYLPLDPVYPKGRIEYILKDAGVRFLITEEELTEGLQGLRSEIICIDKQWNEISKENAGSPEVRLLPENIAYVIYTSGSTGKPKGSIVQHSSLSNYCRLIAEAYSSYFATGPVNVIMNTTVMFDASIAQMIFMLYGNTLYIPPESLRHDSIALIDYIIKNKISVLDSVPVQLKAFISGGLFSRTEWSPSLVISGGEALDESTWKELCLIDKCDFFNCYGPTECTVDSSICRVRDYPNKPTIGKPPLNVEACILDGSLNLIPIGAVGELCIGGISVGRGYLNNPGLTAEKFVPAPMSMTPGERLYRTGDMARFNPDGTIEFLGRLDNQVKLRGFRIELGEIEQVLMQHPDVKDAVVLLKERKEGPGCLISYITLRDYQHELSGKTSSGEIKEFLKGQLPDYMIPPSIVILKEMPLGPNGKIDRRALPEPEIESLPEEETAPKTQNEQILLEVWKEVLGLKTISLRDNFFEIGGDSILAIQVVAKANQKGLKILTKHIFQYPDIFQLSRAALENALPGKEIVKGKDFPLTPIQRWFFEQNFPQKNHWNQSVLLEVNAKLEIDDLNKIFSVLIHHHDAFGLKFTPSGDGTPGWTQYYPENLNEPEVHKFNLGEILTPEIPSAIRKISSSLQSELNIESGPLTRIAYFDLGENRNARLLIVVHHLIIDGISWRIILKDLETLFGQLKAGLEMKLPEKTASYQEWSLGLQEYAADPKVRKDLDYWTAIRKKPLRKLPLDFKHNENLEASSDALTTIYDKSQTSQLLNEINAKYHTKTNEILLSALLLTFAEWSGQNSLLLDLEGHGREDTGNNLDVSYTVGWFTSVFPVCLETMNPGDIGLTICSVKEELRNIPQNGFSCQLLQNDVERELSSENKILQAPEIIFNYLGQFDQLKSQSTIFEIAAEDKGIERGLKNKRSHLLEISALIVDGSLNVQWNYSGKHHRKETIQTLSGIFLSSVTRIISHCLSKENGTYTPSDFQDVKLNTGELKDILSEINGIGDE